MTIKKARESELTSRQKRLVKTIKFLQTKIEGLSSKKDDPEVAKQIARSAAWKEELFSKLNNAGRKILKIKTEENNAS